MKKVCFLPGNVTILDCSRKGDVSKDSFIVKLFRNILILQNNISSLKVFYFDKYNGNRLKNYYKNTNKYNIPGLIKGAHSFSFPILFIDNLNTLAIEEGHNFNILMDTSFNIEFMGEISEGCLNSLKSLSNKYKEFVKLCEKIEIESNKWYLYPVYLVYEFNRYMIGFILWNRNETNRETHKIFDNHTKLLLLTGIEDRNIDKEFLLLLKLTISRIFAKATHIDDIMYEFDKGFKTIYSAYFDNSNLDGYENLFKIDFGNITVGFEIEFECLENKSGNLISAIDILKHYYYNYNKDEEIENNDIFDELLEKRVGIDGSSTVGECRSNYYLYSEVEKQIEEFENLIESVNQIVYDNLKVRKRFRDVTVNFIGYKNSLGFHYHIGCERNVDGLIEYNKKNLVLIFDLVFGFLLRNLNSSVRMRSDYSNFSNTESKSYGFEYRTLSSSIAYNDLYKYVLKMASKILDEYFTNNYLEINLDSKLNIPDKFYKKYVDNFNDFIRRIFETVKIINMNCFTFYKNRRIHIMNKTTDSSEFDNTLFKMLQELNNYTKNCWIYLFGLKKNRGDFVHNIVGVENCISDYMYFTFPYVEKEINILNRKYYHIPFGLSYKIRNLNYSNLDKADHVYIKYFIYLLTEFLERLESRKLLKIKPEKIMNKLKEKYSFLKLFGVKEKLKV